MKVPVSITNGFVVKSTDVINPNDETDPDLKIAYSYLRFSSLEQKKGASTSRQSEAALQWCEANGYTLSKEQFRDEGKSGYKGKNLKGDGDLKRFLSLVEKEAIKKGSVLVLESYDRLSRLPLAESVGLFINLINAGIGMVFTMTHDKKVITQATINKEPYILYAIIGEAQRAHQESKHKADRVRDAYNRRKEVSKKDGTPRLGWCPPWCDFVDGLYVVNKERAAIIIRIYDEYLKGNGTWKIANTFNREGLKTLGHRSKAEYRNTSEDWYKKTVKDFLVDARVYGYSKFLDKEHYYPAIIRREKFNAVQNRLAQRHIAPKTGGPMDGVGNLFTGILRCGHCGEAMIKTVTNKTYKGKVSRYEYLVCNGASAGKRCKYSSIRYGDTEAKIIAFLKDDKFFQAMTETNPNKAAQDKRDSLEGERQTHTNSIAKMLKMIEKMDEPPTTIAHQMKILEDRISVITKEIKITDAQIKATNTIPANFHETVKKANELIKTKEGRLKLREFLRATVESITVNEITDGVPSMYTVTSKQGFELEIDQVLRNRGARKAESLEEKQYGIYRSRINLVEHDFNYKSHRFIRIAR